MDALTVIQILLLIGAALSFAGAAFVSDPSRYDRFRLAAIGLLLLTVFFLLPLLDKVID